MATTIGLMGFERFGRNLFRILYQSEDIKLAVISDIIRSTYSSTFDSMATMVQKENVSKTLA